MPEVGGYFWPSLLLTLALSCAVGTLSYRYVEEPAQRRFRNGFRITSGRRKPVPEQPVEPVEPVEALK
jgi:peptidoglycan/LPS O-acetylase OafA/YrhL